MRVSTLVPVALIGAAAAVPLVARQSLQQTEHTAGGTIPTAPLSHQLTPGAMATFMVIALNELFEVSYFNKLLENIPKWGDCHDKGYATETFQAIAAQEQLHADGANAILTAGGGKAIEACDFAFPVNSYTQAIQMANTFTDVVLSVLPTAQLQFAKDNDGDETNYVQLVGSIIAQEGEQNGWFRSQQGKLPSAAPFLTTSGGQFGYSFLKGVINNPKSCDAVTRIEAAGVTPFPALTYGGRSGNWLHFSVPAGTSLSGKSLAYLTGGNTPVVVSITPKSATTFWAPASDFARGLTVAALVNSAGPFADAPAVAKATTNGPGIIETEWYH